MQKLMISKPKTIYMVSCYSTLRLSQSFWLNKASYPCFIDAITILGIGGVAFTWFTSYLPGRTYCINVSDSLSAPTDVYLWGHPVIHFGTDFKWHFGRLVAPNDHITIACIYWWFQLYCWHHHIMQRECTFWSNCHRSLGWHTWHSFFNPEVLIDT